MKLTTKITGEIPEGHKAVFTAHVGDRFYIGHTRNVLWIEKHVRELFFKLHGAGVDKEELFLPIVSAASKLDLYIITFKIEFTSESGYHVLKHELGMFQEWFGKKECLNKNNVPYIPKTVRAKKGSNWLTENEALNFRKLLTKYNY